MPRCLKSKPDFDCVELHCFRDASSLGYDACAYLKFIHADGSIYRAFVIGRSRVAPLKHITIPKLELTAAIVAAKLRHRMLHERQYQFKPVVMWTDSTTVLKYICNTCSRF